MKNKIEVKKELQKNDLQEITQNKSVLKGFALGCSIDWNKKTNIFVVGGGFTINQLKLICGDDSKIVICKIENFDWGEIEKTELKCIEYRQTYLNINDKLFYEYNLNYYYTKAEFEKDRKNTNNNFIIISQNKNDLLPEKNRNQVIYNYYDKMTMFDRFRNIKELKKVYYNYNSPIYKYIGFDFENTRHKTQAFYFEETNTSEQYFDKNGYILAAYKKALQNNLIIYKREKERQKANNENITQRITEKENQIETTKKNIIKLFEVCNDYDKTTKLYNMVDILRWCYFHLQEIKTREQQKNWISTEQQNNHFEIINKSIERINEQIKELKRV